MWNKNCNYCGKNWIYKNKKSFDKACKDNSKCRSCCQSGKIVWNTGKTKNTDERVNKLSKSLIKSWKIGKKLGRTTWNSGLTITDPRVERNSKKSTNTLIKRYNSGEIVPWNKGKKLPKISGKNSSNKRPEVRKKLRLATIKRIKKMKGRVCPNYNFRACELFKQINDELKWNGKYAENGGEYYIKKLGYFVDYYEPKLNVVIEYDEKYHNKTKYIEKDKIRQQEIVNYLKCKFYRIKQGEESKWKQILEIQY